MAEKKPVVEKGEMRSLEVRALAGELQQLRGSRLDKVYQPCLRELYFQFSARGKGKALLRIIVPQVAYLASRKPEMTAVPKGLCVLLRKHISNAFLDRVEQLGFDRIIMLTFGKGENSYHVIIELFGKGNVILCGKDLAILHALTYRAWRDRSVKRGVQYELPPSRGNPLEMDREDFDAVLSSGEEIVRALATGLGLGNAYAEEVCLLAGVDKKTAKPQEKELKALWDKTREIMERKPEPQVVWRTEADGTKVLADVVLFPLKFYGPYEQEPAETLSAALETAFRYFPFAEGEGTGGKQGEKIAQLERVLRSQEEMVSSLKEGIAGSQRKGELIYEHYPEIAKLLEEIRGALRTQPWDEVRELFERRKGILQIDAKSRTVTVDILAIPSGS